MTPREVFDRHLLHMQSGDLDKILSDYSPDAVAADPDGMGSGLDHIRDSYRRLLPAFESADLSTDIQVCGEVVYVTYHAARNDQTDLAGTDTFVIRNGLIDVHTFYAHPSPEERAAAADARDADGSLS